MKYLIIFLFALLPFFAQAQLLRAYGVVEIGSTFPTSSVSGPKYAYRTTDSSFYRWIHTNVWVKVVEPSITPDTLYLQQISGTTAIVNGDTINLTPYVLKTDTTSILTPYIKLAGWGLLKSTNTLTVDSTLLATKTFTNRFLLKTDTAAMLVNYPSTAGYGILKNTKTIRADTSSPNGLATRLFAKTLPTSILTGQVAYSNGSNLIGNSGLTYSSSVMTITNNINDSSPNFIKLSNGGSGINTGATIEFPLGQKITAAFTSPLSGGVGFTFYDRGGTNAVGLNSALINFSQSATVATTVNDGMLTLSAPNGTSSSIRHYTGGQTSFFTYSIVAANYVEVARFAKQTGNLLLGTTTDVATSILTAGGTTKGSLPFPRGTTAERNAITGVAHLNWGNTTTNTTDVYDGSMWTSYGRLNATQTWSGTNTFQANGVNGAIYWTTSNSSYSNILRAQSASNSPRPGNFQKIGIVGASEGLYFQNGTNSTILAGPGNSGGGGVELMTAVSATPEIKLQSGYESGVNNNATIQINHSRSITNPAVTTGNIRVVSLTPTFNISNPNTISISSFYYNPTLTALNGASHNFIESVAGDWYVGSTSGVMGIRTAPDAAYELKLNGDLFVQDSLRLTTTPAHTSITGLLTRDASGWVGQATLGTGLSYSGGVLSGTWLKPELEASRDVDITGGTSTDFRLRSNTRTQFDGKFKIGSDSSFIHDPTQDTTYHKGNVRIQSGSLTIEKTSGTPYLNIIGKSTGNQEAGIYMKSMGVFSSIFEIDGGATSFLNFYNYKRAVTAGSNFTIGENNGFTGATSYGDFIVVDSSSNSATANIRFKFDSRGDARFYGYGTGTKEAADLSKTQSNYIAGFAIDGTVVEMEDLHVATTGLVTMDEYDNSASFTPNAVGEEATELFLTTSATTGKVLQRGMRQTTNVKDADLAVTDDMLELSFDIHVWAYCSNAASDSVVIDLPTPALDYVSQKVSVYGDGRNPTPGRDVYVRCVGAKLWHGNASPTGETYYQVTSLGGINSKTAEFICVQNPDDSLYYWQLIQHQ